MVHAARSAAPVPRLSTGTAYSVQPYVFIPDGVIEAFVRDPLAVGVYVAVARLALIRKGPVALSAADLALWMGSTAHADQVAIMRRILKLADSSWLCVTRAAGQKHQLLPTWGIDRSGQARPWNFAAVASGRPEHARGRRVPLALLDITLGQLKPQEGRAPALISRYLTHPLLDLTDIGTYTIRLRTEMAPTPRLTHLNLTGDRLPSPRALLMEAAGGTLTTLRGSEAIGVGLTAWGYDQLGIAPPHSEEVEWASGSKSGSTCGSLEMLDLADILPHPDAEKPPSNTLNAHNTWDVGIMELTNMSSPPNMFSQAGGGNFDQVCDSRPAGSAQEQPNRSLENIPDQLAPQIAASHQELNRDRVIFPGEWWELLEIQQAHGERQLLTWQARAARSDRAGVRQISPAYYAACAAQAAVESYRPSRYERAPAPDLELPTDSGLTRPLVPPAPAAILDPACEALLVEMGIRERELLAQVPLALVRQWAAVLDHAGLAARFDDVRGFAHSQMRKQQSPPPRAELDHWAERARTRAASMSPPALTDAQVQAIRERHAALLARAAAIAPDDLSEDERLTLLADLERGMDDAQALSKLQERRAVVVAPPPSSPEQICQAILERFRQPMHRALWPLLDRVTFVVEDETLRIVCQHVADLGVVEAELAMRIRSALRAYDWQPTVRVVARAVPVPAPESEPQPPGWIAPERWATLPGLMRTALLGARLEAGVLCCTAPALTALVQTRFARELAALLEEVRDGA